MKISLEPSGKDFIDELIYRFLLTKGDSLGGGMRNLAGSLGERKFTRTLISTLKVHGKKYSWLYSKSKKCIESSLVNVTKCCAWDAAPRVNRRQMTC
ncbi:AvaI/BsoBI family type II restriction endonuclease [Desulfococcaceae bacterium HSG7]|nr:AvaI/BsoBI family type II restriction endonuclease [Desulfococcaceae bacterium HSG7]